MKIDVYLDFDERPIATFTPPETFKLETKKISDGEHQLQFVASDERGQLGSRVIPFNVHNGPEIVVHGIEKGETLKGDISILTNAYSANRGDEFEPMRIETPKPIPTWAWVLVLCIFGWGAGYVSLELHDRTQNQSTSPVKTEHTSAPSDQAWAQLGEQVYGNNCSSCHQQNGEGLAGVFPPLKGNTVVLNEDPTEHILTILKGVSGKKIDGIDYASPMPGFSSLSDEEVAAVVNHERSQWGNNAKIISQNDVAKLR